MYSYQRPANFAAIKNSIIRRVRERRESQEPMNVCKDMDLLPPCHPSPANGLPSPPVEMWPFEDGQRKESFGHHQTPEMAADALLALSADMSLALGPLENTPTSTPTSTPTLEAMEAEPMLPSPQSSVPVCDSFQCQGLDHLDDEEIRSRIQALQQEKHRLFQIMKSLLSQQQATETPETTEATETTETTKTTEATVAAMPTETDVKPTQQDRPVQLEHNSASDKVPVVAEQKRRTWSRSRSRDANVRKARRHYVTEFRASHYSPYQTASRRPPSPPRPYSRGCSPRVFSHLPPHSKHPFLHPFSSSVPMSYMPRRMARPYMPPPPRPLPPSSFRSSRPLPSRHLPRH